jgi:hypothetical protein
MEMVLEKVEVEVNYDHLNAVGEITEMIYEAKHGTTDES